MLQRVGFQLFTVSPFSQVLAERLPLTLKIQCLMKVVREYMTEGQLLKCKVTFFPETEQEEFDDSTWNIFTYPVELEALVGYPSEISSDQLRYAVRAHPNVSPALLLDELTRFIQTLKQMYAL